MHTGAVVPVQLWKPAYSPIDPSRLMASAHSAAAKSMAGWTHKSGVSHLLSLSLHNF